MPITDAIIVGAGSGTRLGHSEPKAFVDLCGEPILYYSLKTLLAHPSVYQVILVVPPVMVDRTNDFVRKHDAFADRRVSVTAGGAERWESVRNGCLLSAETSNSEWVMIHDAARPFVTQHVIDSVLNKACDFNCVITVTPVVDTIRTIENAECGRCGVTIDRSNLLRVGTPQLFRRSLLLSSFDQIKDMDAPPTDEAALFELLGIKIGFAWGDPLNFKITAPADLEIARALIKEKYAHTI